MNFPAFPLNVDQESTITRVVKKKLTVPVPENLKYLPEVAAVNYLSSHLTDYMPVLSGHLISWSLSKISAVQHQQPPFPPLINIKGHFGVLDLNPGVKLPGEVVEKNGNSILLRAFGLFLVSVQSNTEVTVGDPVQFTFVNYFKDNHSGMMIGKELMKIESLSVKPPSPSPDSADKETEDLSNGNVTESNQMEEEIPESSTKKPQAKGTKRKSHSQDEELRDLEGFPPGWQKKKHQTEKNTWYTFINPDGKSFKTLKKAKEAVGLQPRPQPGDFKKVISELMVNIEKMKPEDIPFRVAERKTA